MTSIRAQGEDENGERRASKDHSSEPEERGKLSSILVEGSSAEAGLIFLAHAVDDGAAKAGKVDDDYADDQRADGAKRGTGRLVEGVVAMIGRLWALRCLRSFVEALLDEG